MKITYLYSGEDNETHITELEVPGILEASGRYTTGMMAVLGGGFGETRSEQAPRDFHNAVRRWFVAVLKGGIELETGDGSTVQVLPGEIFLADDPTGRGHKTRDLEVPTRVMYMLAPEDFDPQAWKVESE